MDGFAYWIFGYQKFAEPIIRECICMKKGWKDIFSKVQVPDNSELLEKLEKRTDWDNDFPLLKLNAVKEIGKRKRRMVLDGAFLDQNGKTIISEFKSWGGFEKFDVDKLHHEVASGILFPDRLAIDKIYYEQDPTEVSKFVIATNLSEQDYKKIVWEIGDLTIEVLDIAELLKEYGKSVAEKIGSFEQLEKSVASVKDYVNTGQT